MRPSELFALACGTRCDGHQPCIYCGAPASERYEIPDSFTQQSTLLHPASGFRCVGCALSMREVGTATYPDGSTKEWTRSFVRYHNWWLSPNEATPFTYAHREWIKSRLLNPPPGEWACILTTGGQRHFVYLARSGAELSPVANLDGLIVYYAADRLAERCHLTTRLAACVGAVGLEGEPGAALWCAAVERWGDSAEPLLAEWSRVWSQPLSRLALYLTPKKEEALRECGF